MTSNQRKKRRKYLLEQARLSILQYAPAPLTTQEIHDHKWIQIMRSLISDTKKALYRSPGEIIDQKEYNTVPKNNRETLREPYRQLSKSDKVF